MTDGTSVFFVYTVEQTLSLIIILHITPQQLIWNHGWVKQMNMFSAYYLCGVYSNRLVLSQKPNTMNPDQTAP